MGIYIVKKTLTAEVLLEIEASSESDALTKARLHDTDDSEYDSWETDCKVESYPEDEDEDLLEMAEAGEYRPTDVSVTRQLDLEKLGQARRLAQDFLVDADAI